MREHWGDLERRRSRSCCGIREWWHFLGIKMVWPRKIPISVCGSRNARKGTRNDNSFLLKMLVQVELFQCHERCSKLIIKKEIFLAVLWGFWQLCPLACGHFFPHMGSSLFSSSLAPLWPRAVLKSDARAQGRFQDSVAAIFPWLLRFPLALGDKTRDIFSNSFPFVQLN